MNSVFEQFLQPAERSEAVVKLTNLGQAALPILESLFSGEAKNQWRVPYRQLGMPLDCGLVVVSRLGPLAKPLEPYVTSELKLGNRYAASALGSLGLIQESSIQALAASLESEDPNLSAEAAHALMVCNMSNHQLVQEAIQRSKKAAAALSNISVVKFNQSA